MNENIWEEIIHDLYWTHENPFVKKLKKRIQKLNLNIIFIYENENFGFGGIVNKNYSIECVY
jgi:hypothetical protein